MDPTSAVGIASAVIQFVDFSTKVIVGARHIYTSTDGVLDEHIELEQVTEDLRKLSGALTRSANTSGDESIADICRACRTLSEELISMLQSLKLPPETNHKTWHTVRIALRTMRKEEAIRKLDHRLERLQSQLNTRLLFIATESMAQQLKSLKSGNTELVQHTTTQLQLCKDEILGAVKKTNRKLNESKEGRKHMATEEKRRAQANQKSVFTYILGFFRALDDAGTGSVEEDEEAERTAQSNREKLALESIRILPKIDKKLKEFSEEAKKVARTQEILRSLCYEELHDRFGSVTDPHSKTFEWIMTRKELGFEEWLRSGNNVYWISGEPGSGKSTLIKFVYKHQTTQELLQEWAGESKLIIAEHFFWVGGNNMQRSQQGLFQSILYHVLRQHPAAVPDICSERWNDLENHYEPWSLSSLKQCISRLSTQMTSMGKICLFIDGLDEYNGEHQTIVNVFAGLASSTNIKLCVASRSWNVFRHAYERLEHKLYMQEQTRNDIRKFVEDKLGHDQYLKSKVSGSDCDSDYDVVEHVIEKAEGIFIWVDIVINLLLKACQDRNDLDDLRKKIENYPKGLEPLFKRIMADIPDYHYESSARILKVCLDAERPQPIIVYSFLEKIWKKKNYTIGAVPTFNKTHELKEAFTDLGIRLKARCGDFIRVSTQDTSFMGYKVNFFHRTARDFMASQQRWLNDHAGDDFNVSLSLCRAILGVIKSTKFARKIGKHAEETFLLVDEVLLYAHDAEVNGEGVESMRVLDELDRFLSEISAPFMQGAHWSNARMSLDRARKDQKSTFLELVVEAGLCWYVQHRLQQNDSLLKQKESRPLLDYALRPWSASNDNVPRHHEPHPRMVQILLDYGSDPNQQLHIYDGQTVWAYFLVYCYNRGSQDGSLGKDICEIMKSLLGSGANPNVKCTLRTTSGVALSAKWNKRVAKQVERQFTVDQVILKVFPDEEDENKDSVFAKLKEKRTSGQ